MDTPERNQIGTSLSKFEDSPVFNYINNLSPIKSVKSLHITQAFSSISFASLPSIFTSPHVSSAHKESRFLLRHCNSDPSKPECSSENESGNKVCTGEGIVMDATQHDNKSAVLHENCDLAITVGEASAEPNSDDSNFVIELPRCLKYDCGSPNCESAPSGNKVDSAEEPSASLVPFVEETSEKGSSDVEARVQGMCEIDQKQEPTLCGWEGLNCDASDMLIFNSPNTTETLKGLLQTSLEPVTSFCNSLMPEILQKDIYNEQHMHSSDLLSCEEQQKAEDPSSQLGEAVPQEQVEQLQGTIDITGSSNGVSSERMDNEVETCTTIACKSVFNLHRGLRRRCLDFEMAGARKKNLGDSSNISISLQSDEKTSLNDRQVVQIKPGSDSRRTLPGIGLHLNALAINSKDQKITNNETLSSGRHSLILNPTPASYSNTADQEPLLQPITSDCSEGDIDATGSGGQLMHDACPAEPFLANEEFNHNSPKKKRRKLENIGDNDVACKRCNCKKSKCLKLYCECFAAGVYCIEPCSCQDCFNKPIHEDTVLATRKQIESRNPLAFAPKVIRSSDSVPEFGDESSKTPASARHKRGCNCKKSNCLKKYCECYQGGVGCSIGCRCEGCKNAFGRKDGIEAELNEDETEACEKDKPSEKLEILNNGEQNPAYSLPMTPLRLSRQLVTLPFSSKGKLPGSSFLTISSSSGLYGGQKLGQQNILRSQPKFEKQMQSAPEDEMPENLQGDCSPSTGIKTSSPNSKRISPPQCDFGPSPARRSGRKLILQSIPSFPSLTQQ